MIKPGAVGAMGIPVNAYLVAFDLCRACCGSRRHRPDRHFFANSAVIDRLGVSVGGGVSVSPPPSSIRPWHSISLGGHSGGFIPLGQLFHSRGVNYPWRLDSPSHSLAIPPGVFRHSGGLWALLSYPYSRGIFGWFFLPARDLLSSPFSYQRLPPTTTTPMALEVTSLMSHPPAAAPPGTSYSPLPSDSHTIVVSAWPTSPPPRVLGLLFRC